MATNNNNLVDNVLDAQKKVLDTVVENTKKLTGSNNVLNETIEKGTDWYKNWLETQKTMFSKVTGSEAENGKARSKTSTEKEATATANDFLESWMNTQTEWAKKVWEMSQESAKKFGVDASTNPFAAFTGSNNNNPFAAFTGGNNANPFAAWTGTNANPFAAWQNAMNTANNPMTAWMNQMTANNWMNQIQQMNPFTPEAIKKTNDSLTGMFTEYYNSLSGNFAEWQKNFENGTVQDAYKNMINSGEGFTKFAEMWMPMIKSMQEKTFSMDEYKKMMNPEVYKEFMDKFFGFMPESGREYMDKMSSMMKDSMKQATDAGTNGYNQFRDMMSKMNNGSQSFGNMYNTYENFMNQISEAAAPFTKLMPASQHTKTLQEWNDISKRITEYNIKNAELQYMIYTQGAKVMDKLAENTAKKIKDGGEVKSIIDMYQEWMHISDKVYVTLFESTEYSELMAEVGSMQMKLRKDIEAQTEKMFKDIPVVTRSQMDEVYKTIYELKKKVRSLEKMLDIEGDVEEVEPVAKATAKKSTAKTAAKSTAKSTSRK